MSVALLLAVAACGDDDGITTQGPPPPAAIARFVNTGTNWGTVDLRFVDRVENLPTMLGVPFRSYSGGYQRVEPGQRLARVFPYSTSADTTRISLLGDLSLNLQAGTRYTMVYAGRTADAPDAERHRLAVLEDPVTLPSPAGNEIAIKVLHTVVGVGSVQVFIVPVASATAATPADYQTNNVGQVTVDYLQQSAYVTVPARNVPRTADTATQLYRFVVAASGAPGTPLIEVTPNQPGALAPAPGNVGHGTVGPQPGVQIPGSVLTAVVAPGAAVGSRGATAANQTPSVVLLIDKPLNVTPSQ